MLDDARPMGFLGVSSSLTGQVWSGPSIETERAAEALAQATGLPDAVARVLAQRRVPPAEVEGFLAPTLRDMLPDPSRLKDAPAAAACLVEAVRRKARIAIFADYDVDGAASAALLIDWLRVQALDATLYVPDRIDEGYGPNAAAIAGLAASHDLIVCVDCGTLSHDALSAAGDTDVLVLDHHLGGETLPPARAVVNPNRQDETGELGHICAVGVVFLTLVEASRQMRREGSAAPDLMAGLDLVALATIADVAPLQGVNRAFVRTGLRVMAQRARPGLRALADVAGLDEAPRPYHLGYLLGPRINAGGRIGQASLGAQLLATQDTNAADRIAADLDRLNQERREIEKRVTEEALSQAEARGSNAPLVWAAGEGWHPGVVGIVAARLKEALHRPAVVIGLQNGVGKGSGRSVSGIDLGASIQRLVAEGLLSKGGGHRMAAGLTLKASLLTPAMERLGVLLERQGAGATGPRTLALDGVLMPQAVTVDLIERLEEAGPFGAGAPAPRFALPDMRVLHAREVGSGHLKLRIGDPSGSQVDAIAFGAFDTALGAGLLDHGGDRFHVAGRLDLNVWQGRTIPQLRLEDASRCGP